MEGGVAKAEKRSTVLRRLLNEPGCLTTIWGGTAHHAQLAEYAGFEVFGLSGSKTSTWIYGMRDAGYLTQSELVENTRNICNAVKILVLVDADTGHGNALAARRSVQLLIQAGAAGCFIEDQKAAKRCRFVKGKELISVEEAAGKYRAVCELRDQLDPDLGGLGVFDLTGFPEVVKFEERYLPEAELNKYQEPRLGFMTPTRAALAKSKRATSGGLL